MIKPAAGDGRTAENLTPGPCPLCGNAGSDYVTAVDFGSIWQTLESTYHVRFASDVMERHTPSPQARLWGCATCGLQFFSPVKAGDSEFWGTLSQTSEFFYHSDKPEFQVVLRLVRPGMRVLDVGSGRGTFTAAAARLGAESIGLDQNEGAVTDARARGIDIRIEPLEAFALRNATSFDIVTLFQVIEHVPSVVPFVTAAYECVKPGGLLVIGVPNRNRLRPAGFEVLDHPPHHVSRWDATAIRWLASSLGAYASLEFERLSEREALGLHVGQLFSATGGPRLRARNALVKVTWLIVFARLGWPLRDLLRRRGWLDGFGHTLIAKIQRPI